ncbi:unnamed protein product [Rotaria socialis]|uniref:Uncharacterized protein n=1 Tax=Rotaria socialis TaxID=392032 RepID=A0A818FF34_9BILA|nr:unnamed protein product [Rotaria socialis]CAF3470978.1 unnamed protein product [Rotaria socialis]CAF3473985.1 unnamed protein product [Rotaria socialis]
MLMIKWQKCIFIFFLLSIYKLNKVHSIHCCVGDNTCTAESVDCPSNVCFKLVFNKISEYRGCMTDLMKSLGSQNINSQNLDENSGTHSGSSNDQCQKIDTQGAGMSLYHRLPTSPASIVTRIVRAIDIDFVSVILLNSGYAFLQVGR